DAASGWIRFLHGGADGIGPDSLVGDVGSRAGGKLPYSMGIDRFGQIFIAPNGEGRVLRVDRATGAYLDFVNGDDIMSELSGLGGPAIGVHTSPSNGIAGDPQGNLYFTDFMHAGVLRVDAPHAGAPVGPGSRIREVADLSAFTNGEFFVADHLALG